jgi:hypothetical protein
MQPAAARRNSFWASWLRLSGCLQCFGLLLEAWFCHCFSWQGSPHSLQTVYLSTIVTTSLWLCTTEATSSQRTTISCPQPRPTNPPNPAPPPATITSSTHGYLATPLRRTHANRPPLLASHFQWTVAPQRLSAELQLSGSPAAFTADRLAALVRPPPSSGLSAAAIVALGVRKDSLSVT